MQLDLNQLRELLADIDKTNISELTLKSTDFELTVRKEISVSDRSYSGSVLTTGVQGSELTLSPTVAPSGSNLTSKSVAPSQMTPPSATTAPLPADPKWVEVTSPMVGTFYRSPGPDEPPFVEKGDRISSTQTVCIIEAMKLMNEIEAEVSGEVMEILVENGTPVEYGQPLMRVNPD